MAVVGVGILFINVFEDETKILIKEQETKRPEFKTCEWCKETDIKYDAVICKHCGKDPDGQEGENIRLERNLQWVEEMSEIKKMREADKTPNIPVQLPIILGVFVAIGGIIFWSIPKPDDCDS